MDRVFTPDGWGHVLRAQSAHGRTSYFVKGASFQGWYDGLEVTADFADLPDDVVPNDDNSTTLPYPSRAQGPGWDTTNSTIQPNIDPHLEIGGASDSLTGESTGEDPVDADIEGLFEPSSHLSSTRAHRVHFAALDDPILDVSTLPETSPTSLDESPINPDGVDTEDLFDGSRPHFEPKTALYDKLVIEDSLSFMKFASDDDDDEKKNHHERGQNGYVGDNDSDDDGDSDSDSSDSSDGGGSDGGGGHTASVHDFALTTTADLHFLANFCSCASILPLHSKSEHRELRVEAEAPNGVTPQEYDLEKLLERYETDNFHYQESNLRNLVDHSLDSADASAGYNHYASVKTAAPAQEAGPTQIESQIEQLMQFWAVDNNGWWHWTGSQADLALLNQMQQQMMAVGMPGGPPGQMQAQSSFVIESNTPDPWKEYLRIVASDRLVALAAWKDVVQKSKRLRSEGAITLEVFKPDVITAYVQGDNGKYYTTVQRLGSVGPGVGRQLTSTQVSGWSCECEWGHWAWLRKRSFVGRMCSHAYALFSEMRSLDHKARRQEKGKPFSTVSSVGSKTAWSRTEEGGFEWVSNDLKAPTAAIVRHAAGWNSHVWSDGTSEDSFHLGTFKHSEQARRATARVITAHVKFAEEGDVDVVGGPFKPYDTPDSISGGYDMDPYTEDGVPEPILSDERQQGSSGIQESQTRVGFSVLAEQNDGQDDEGSEETDDGIEEEDNPDDEQSLDEEVAEDEGDDESDAGPEEGLEPEESTDDGDDGELGHEEPHQRDNEDDEGTDNPGDESDDEGIEKQSAQRSSVTELQQQYGLSHLAGANYSPSQQDSLVREGDGKTARNLGDLNLNGTHYQDAKKVSSSPDAEDVLAFLF